MKVAERERRLTYFEFIFLPNASSYRPGCKRENVDHPEDYRCCQFGYDVSNTATLIQVESTPLG